MGLEESLEVAARTDSGMVRSHNEDSIAVDQACGLMVLADGMGGYNAGEVASGIAVSVMMAEIAPAVREGPLSDANAVSLLERGVSRANSSIFEAAQSDAQYAGMGTTVVSALFFDNRVAVAHVGDSRLYRLRGGVIEAITRDHSLLQEQLDCGMITADEARHSQNRNLVTRAVGIDAELDAEIHLHEVLVGDIYLLCSDGLNDMLEDEDIGLILHSMQGNLELAADHLIQSANDNGGKDNVSVILVKVKQEFARPRSRLSKLFNWLRK